jgi:hypothetical protein
MICLSFDVFMGRFRCGMISGVGKAMLMRGGACAAELCLLMGCVCVIGIGRVVLPSCGLWECVLRFLGVLDACRTLFGISLYNFGFGCLIPVE